MLHSLLGLEKYLKMVITVSSRVNNNLISVIIKISAAKINIFNKNTRIPNPGIPSLLPLDGSKVGSAFHSSVVNQMNISNFWGFSGKK